MQPREGHHSKSSCANAEAIRYLADNHAGKRVACSQDERGGALKTALWRPSQARARKLLCAQPRRARPVPAPDPSSRPLDQTEPVTPWARRRLPSMHLRRGRVDWRLPSWGWHVGGYRPCPRRRRRRRIADRHPDLEQKINALDQAAPLGLDSGGPCCGAPALAVLRGDRSLPTSPETAALVSHVLPNCDFREAIQGITLLTY